MIARKRLGRPIETRQYANLVNGGSRGLNAIACRLNVAKKGDASMKLWRGAAIAACIVGFPQVAAAQSSDTAANRADARLARLDKMPSEAADRLPASDQGAPASKPPFSLTLTFPLTFNSNVENADAGRKQALHGNPSVAIDYRQQAGTLRLFARSGADIDAYTSHSENDASTVFGRLGVRLYDDKLGSLKPYLQYAPVAIFGSGLKDHQLTLHTFTLGAGGEVPLGAKALTYDFNVARREATVATAERTQVSGLAEISGDFIPDKLSWSVGATVQGRFFTGGTNDGRRDVNVNASAGLSLSLGARAGLDIGVSVERNSSNRVGKDYTTLDVGPALRLKIPFGG
jgi:hypothetical protein